VITEADTQYPERGTWWTVDACLRDIRRRILVEVVGGGHGHVVFEHRGKRFSVCVLVWNRMMGPIRKPRKG
jgi:hypothetical protein